MITMKTIIRLGKKSRLVMRRLICTALFGAALISPVAQGQALDSVDVQARGDDAEIVMRFATSILYLRHNPQKEGRALRIYFRFVGVGVQEIDLTPYTRRLRAFGPAPGVSISFPEPDGSVSVTFDESAHFSVRPNADGRSISVLIAGKPGG